MYEIEKAVLIPEKGGGGVGRTFRYPWAAMEVGDSFLVADRTLSQVISAAYNQARRHGGRFTARKVEGGVRIWRIE